VGCADDLAIMLFSESGRRFEEMPAAAPITHGRPGAR
jgi:hypothetical protein